MPLTPKEIAQLNKIIGIAQELIEKAGGEKKAARQSGSPAGVRIRRAGKDLAAFRKMLKAERKAGVPVAKIAKKHGISASYIYQLG